jgi:4-carboxymuconolactone decarboxylase
MFRAIRSVEWWPDQASLTFGNVEVVNHDPERGARYEPSPAARPCRVGPRAARGRRRDHPGTSWATEVWLRNPQLCDRVRRLGDYARWDASAPRDLAELAVLVSAAHFAAWPEFDAHARFAEDSGIGADVIATLRDGGRPEFGDARRAAVHDLVAEYFATNRVAQPTFATALGAIGEAALVDVVAIAGYYAMVCMTVNVFEISG